MKTIFTTLFISLALVIIALPLCSNNLILSAFKNRRANDDMRIDLIVRGNKDSAVKILDETKFKNIAKDKVIDGENIVLINDINYDTWCNYKISIQAIQDSELLIIFRGSHRTGTKQHPVIMDYRDLKINGKNILDKQRAVWYENPYRYKINIKDQDTIKIDFCARRHHIMLGDLKNVYKTNLWILFAISVLSFILIHKSVHYIANFKIVKQNCAIETIFVCVFFVLLFIPICKIDKSDKSTQENRLLAKAPELLSDNGINPKFGNDAEKWFNDRFLGRTLAIKLDSVVKYMTNQIYAKGDALFLSMNNWMFRPVSLQLRNLTECSRQISDFNKFCKHNNVKLYILIVPRKESVYHDILEGCYAYNMKEDSIFANRIDSLRQETGIPIIHPYEELNAARQSDYVFFKQTHHWTDWGAYIGYRALMKEISRDFPDIEIVSLNSYKKFTSRLIRDEWNRDFHIGHTTRLLDFDYIYAERHLLKDDYVYYDHMEADNLMIQKTGVVKNFTRNTGGGYRIMVAGDSQNENLLQFLPYSAKQLKFVRLNMLPVSSFEQKKFLKYHKKELVDFKPDILVYCISAASAGSYFLGLTK